MLRLSLRRNFSWTVAGQGVFALAQWSIVAMLARIGGAEELGRYVLALAVVTPITTFASMRLRSVQASDSKGEFDFIDYFSLRVVCVCGAFVVVLGASFLVGVVGGGGESAVVMIVLVGVAKSLDLVGDVFHGHHQRGERMDRVAKSFVARGVGWVLFFVLGYYRYGLLGGGVGLVAASALVLILIDARALRDAWRFVDGSRPMPSPTRVRQLAAISLPLGLTSTAASIAVGTPRYFIEFEHGTALLGAFAAMLYPTVAAGMLVTALAQSAVSRLSNQFQSGDIMRFQRTLGRLVGFGFALGVVSVLLAWGVGELAILGVYGQEYVAYHSVMVWGMVNAAVGYCYLFLGTALSSMRQFSVQLPIHLASLGVLSLACWMLVGEYGLNGALASMSLAVGFEVIAYGVIVLRHVRDAGRRGAQVSVA